MIGLCLEAETTCSNCSSTLAINALTEKIVCSQCLHENTFTINEWKELLEDLFKEVVNFEENEGQPTTIFGSRTFKLIKGRQLPKFSDTKSYIDMEVALSSAANGKINNPQSNLTYSIRPVPSKFKSACPEGTYLLCEDLTQIPGTDKDLKSFNTTSEIKIIPFTCPSCAGALEINGSERTLKCKFCGTQSYISDTIWQKLHPVKEKQRFYFYFNENALPFEWDSNVWDVTADANGILYMSIAPMFSSDEKLWIVALNPDLTVKWKRKDLKFKTTTSGGEAKLTLNSNNELIVWSRDRNAIVVLSTSDGTEIKRIGKKLDNADEKEFTAIDFTKCNSIAGDVDGNYVVMVNRNLVDSDNHECYEFMIMDKDGNLKLPWNTDPQAGKGLFGKLAGIFFSVGDAVYFEKMVDKTYKLRDNDIKLTVGMDGSYYFRASRSYFKYDRSGKQIYLHAMDEQGYAYGNIIGDKNGNSYYIFSVNDKSSLIKVSATGDKKEILIASVLNGGSFCKEDKLAISANGTIYTVGYSGLMRTFTAEGKLKYASAESLKDEKELKEEEKEMED